MRSGGVNLAKKVVLAVLLGISPVYARAVEVAPAQAAAVPDWALGVMTVRQLGKTIDKVGAYANQVVPNLGELSKQFTLNMLFPDFPVRAGLKADAPVLIYLLDPMTTGLQNATAYVLPVADAAELKASLANTMGAPAEADGVMTFTLVQPPPKDDKLLLAKFEKDLLLLAPDAATLKRLGEFAANEPAAALTGSATADVVVTVKIERFKRLFGKLLEGSLELGAMMAAQGDPAQSEKLVQKMKMFTETLWQIDVLEAQLSIDEKEKKMSAALSFVVRPATGTALAALLKKPIVPVSGKIARFLPQDAAIASTWTMNGADWAGELRKAAADPVVAPGAPKVVETFQKELVPALLTMLETASGEAALAITGRDGGFSKVLVFESTDPAKTAADVKTTVDKVTAVTDAAIREEIKAGGGDVGDKPLIIAKALPAEQHAGAALQSYQFDLPQIVPGDQEMLKRAFGWPLAVHTATVGKVFMVVFGKGGLETLKAAVDREKAAPPATQAKNAYTLVSLRPVELIKTLLAACVPETGVDPEKITAGLQNMPATISLNGGDGAAALRLEVPAAVPEAAVQLYQRLKRADVDLQDLVGAGKGGSVPAPPPAP